MFRPLQIGTICSRAALLTFHCEGLSGSRQLHVRGYGLTLAIAQPKCVKFHWLYNH